MRRSVVFPHPEGPSSVKNSFSRMATETSSRALTFKSPPPKILLSDLTSMATLLFVDFGALVFMSATLSLKGYLAAANCRHWVQSIEGFWRSFFDVARENDDITEIAFF